MVACGMAIASGAASEGRLLIAANRLPVTASIRDGGVELVDAPGGLATGLRPWHEKSSGLWIGWPGDLSHATDAERLEADSVLRARGLVPLHLSRDHVERYYAGF